MTSSSAAAAAPPVSQKSAEAFRTISEVAETLKLPQHVLRFWETRFTQIKPLKRAGGRRFYRPEDVELLGAIRLLLYGEGYTIKGVQRILREQGPRAVAALAHKRGIGPDKLPPPVAGDENDDASADAEHAAAPSLDGSPDRAEAAELLRHALADLADCRRLLMEAIEA